MQITESLCQKPKALLLYMETEIQKGQHPQSLPLLPQAFFFFPFQKNFLIKNPMAIAKAPKTNISCIIFLYF